jgi:SAM-dependent methyltransferase
VSAHSPNSGNADQIEYWNGVGGEKWLKTEQRLELGLNSFGADALKAANAKPGERVIDIGCGTGPTSLKLAQAVAPGGSVLGVDVSQGLIDEANARAKAAGIANARFIVADASTQPFKPEHDLLFSRFGVMFFADPIAAFAHLRGALRPGGRVAFVCWRAFKENGWAFIPFMAAVPHLPPIERPAPNAPGPFAFADADRVRDVLGQAGFAGITVDKVDHPLPMPGDLEQSLRFATEFGPLAQFLAAAPEDMRLKAVAAVREALVKNLSSGNMSLPGACWLVQARN